MNNEESVRFEHDFKKALGKYLELIATMNDEEIELAMGRLSDMIELEEVDSERLQLMFKRTIMEYYYTLRSEGKKVVVAIKRVMHSLGVQEHYREKGIVAYNKAMDMYSLQRIQYTKALFEWKNSCKNLPMLRRILYHQGRPASPRRPASRRCFIKKSVSNASLREYLVDLSTNFELVAKFQELAGQVKMEDVEVLAP